MKASTFTYQTEKGKRSGFVTDDLNVLSEFGQIIGVLDPPTDDLNQWTAHASPAKGCKQFRSRSLAARWVAETECATGGA